MSFEVTATRKRPKGFEDLAGQEFVVSTLSHAIEAERIAHAYLFSGPRGVGKTSSARILSKALNCEKGPTANPCGVCSNCVEIQKGNSLDVIEIDGASNTSVNDIREIKDEVLFAPNSSRYKIYIIDEVHMLSNSAFNALLKTIEEPPPYIVFIFATTEIHKVPATIRSRCQQFVFRLVSPEIITGLLRELCEETSLHAEDEALFWIAKEATGSLRDAFTLFDQVVSFSEGNITLEKIRSKLGLVGLDQMNALVEQMVAGDRSRVLQLADEILFNGVAVEQFVTDVAEYFRNLLFIKSGITKESLLGFRPERFCTAAVQTFSISQLEQGVSLLLDLFRKIRYSISPRYELELALSRLSSLKESLTVSDLTRQLHALRSSFSSAGTGESLPVQSKETAAGMAETNSAPAQSGMILTKDGLTRPSYPWEKKGKAGLDAVNADSGGVSAEDETVSEEEISIPVAENATAPEADTEEKKKHISADELKEYLIERFRKRKLALSSALEKALYWAYNDGKVKIGFSNAYNANFIKRDLPEIGKVLSEYAGRSIELEVGVEEGASVKGSKENDEQLEIVKRVFRGEIIGG